MGTVEDRSVVHVKPGNSEVVGGVHEQKPIDFKQNEIAFVYDPSTRTYHSNVNNNLLSKDIHPVSMQKVLGDSSDSKGLSKTRIKNINESKVDFGQVFELNNE